MAARLAIAIVFAFLAWPISITSGQHEHDHEEIMERESSEQHAAHDDHAEHSDELTVELSEAAEELAGIEISEVARGHIDKTIELPGEIGFNEDRLAHIAPRFAGIALRANYRVGDFVEEGEVVAQIESNESMNSYSIKAPISGWVIDRHITPGEFVSEENSIYIIADLSTVWINLAVYSKDADRIRKGQAARIKAVGSDEVTTGVIEYVTPIIDLRTRSSVARITLSNPDNTWRPGTFVQALITTETDNESLLVRKDAVQFLEEKTVIFVPEGPNIFKPVEVLTGESDTDYIQIVNGLEEGAKYVASGAFELKARIITSNLDAHAGHGH
jgi:cobalt-zinc-cadmium efflux system membrane fusion protein